MNLLAHLHIADRLGVSLPGTMLGDFAKGEIDGRYPPELALAIRLHRRIDSFTDEHEIFRRSKRRIVPERRRYSGVLIDIFYDHFLARDWSEHEDEPLKTFAKRAYAAIGAERHVFPQRSLRLIDGMRTWNLLCVYADTQGIARALRGVSRRLSRPNGLADGIHDLEADYAGFEEDFRAFYPLVFDFARQHVDAARAS